MNTIIFVNSLLFGGAGLVAIGILSSLMASRFGAPLLLVFILIGMVAGEAGPGGILFDDYRAMYLIGSLALAIILFDGGLRTRLASVRGGAAPAILLATVGVVITAGLTGLVAMPLLNLNYLQGFLTGSIVASTDAAAVFFLMRARGLQLRRRVNATIEVESATNDPVAVFLVVLLVTLIGAQGHAGLDSEIANIPLHLMRQCLIGGGLGIGGGLAIAWLINRVTLPAGLHPLFVISLAVMIYGLAGILDGSGFIAVYLAGLVVGNRPVRAFASILSFHDAATWLCQIVMFLVLGLLVSPERLMAHALPALAVAAFLMLVGRPVAVWLCLTPFRFSRQEKTFVSWVGLRGAVSIFLAAIPQLTQVPDAELYFNVAFFVVLVSLLVQGWSVAFVARHTGVALADPAPEISRVEIDLPGKVDLEMVGYPLLADSPVIQRGTLPSWARAVLIVRNDSVLTPEEAGVLSVGDYGYFLVPPDRIRRLDRLFAAFEGHQSRAMSAVFTFSPDIKFADLASAYGVEPDEGLQGLTLGAMFADTFEEGVREGDRLDIGNITLIARSVRDGVVTAIALIVGDTAEDAPLAQSRIVAPTLARIRIAAQRTANRIAEVVHRRRSGRVP
ncbi:MAG: potassium/proton antiporter [Chelatococcus sp.]|uniref:potassium/proton antiporter n=1 Tax=unclassified Chelatococcus TaxID=2638111 RepID=UPI001BCD8D85|nr:MULTISPECIES: potassium/proton antiporter [unclassified Chelatococcus]MBS7740525.1 potassium/proton antiporter [Chelatococcus sp. HY11]MBX3538058.1 potassium/proton antiporter [Chelatococcus sp.]MBX3544691.1 potassium/proton antiporter [Chelatococcus sp.]MCO5078232.1 potassium/proton antiporter [Chelatococcus sp.]